MRYHNKLLEKVGSINKSEQFVLSSFFVLFYSWKGLMTFSYQEPLIVANVSGRRVIDTDSNGWQLDRLSFVSNKSLSSQTPIK